jgi:hypothetical protein
MAGTTVCFVSLLFPKVPWLPAVWQETSATLRDWSKLSSDLSPIRPAV